MAVIHFRVPSLGDKSLLILMQVINQALHCNDIYIIIYIGTIGGTVIDVKSGR